MFICLFGFLTSSSTTRLYRGRYPRLTSGSAVTHETERGDHDLCLSRSHVEQYSYDPVVRGSNPGVGGPIIVPGVI